MSDTNDTQKPENSAQGEDPSLKAVPPPFVTTLTITQNSGEPLARELRKLADHIEHGAPVSGGLMVNMTDTNLMRVHGDVTVDLKKSEEADMFAGKTWREVLRDSMNNLKAQHTDLLLRQLGVEPVDPSANLQLFADALAKVEYRSARRDWEDELLKRLCSNSTFGKFGGNVKHIHWPDSSQLRSKPLKAGGKQVIPKFSWADMVEGILKVDLNELETDMQFFTDLGKPGELKTGNDFVADRLNHPEPVDDKKVDVTEQTKELMQGLSDACKHFRPVIDPHAKDTRVKRDESKFKRYTFRLEPMISVGLDVKVVAVIGGVPTDAVTIALNWHGGKLDSALVATGIGSLNEHRYLVKADELYRHPLMWCQGQAIYAHHGLTYVPLSGDPFMVKVLRESELIDGYMVVAREDGLSMHVDPVYLWVTPPESERKDEWIKIPKYCRYVVRKAATRLLLRLESDSYRLTFGQWVDVRQAKATHHLVLSEHPKTIARGGPGRPVSPNWIVQVTLRDGGTLTRRADRLNWDHFGDKGDIVCYRVLAKGGPQ